MPSEDVDLVSSNLESASYDYDTQILTINFVSGGSYEYQAVPQAIFEGLKRSNSPGSFFHRAIKPRFSGEQV